MWPRCLGKKFTWPLHIYIYATKLSNHCTLSRLPKTNAEACSGKYWHSRNHKQIPLQHGAQISCSAWYRGPLYSFLEFGPGGPTRQIYQDIALSKFEQLAQRVWREWQKFHSFTCVPVKPFAGSAKPCLCPELPGAAFLLPWHLPGISMALLLNAKRSKLQGSSESRSAFLALLWSYAKMSDWHWEFGNPLTLPTARLSRLESFGRLNGLKLCSILLRQEGKRLSYLSAEASTQSWCSVEPRALAMRFKCLKM